MTGLPTETTRERFLRAIAERVPVETIAEVHLFAPMKQGGVESGVGVVAAGSVAGAPAADVPPSPTEVAEERIESEGGPPPEETLVSQRLTVYTARYRLVLKGPERGKWTFTINAEADAPLVTVETVVKGVQRRSGELEDPERISGEQLVAMLPPPPSSEPPLSS